jgi:hypothetical protein
VKERLHQQIAVGGVPEIAHLSTRAFIGQQSKHMQWNGYRDLAYRTGFLSMLDIRLDVFGCRHDVRSPLFVAKAIPEDFHCQLILIARTTGPADRHTASATIERATSIERSLMNGRLYVHAKKRIKPMRRTQSA